MATSDRLTLEEVLAGFDEHCAAPAACVWRRDATTPGSCARSCRRCFLQARWRLSRSIRVTWSSSLVVCQAAIGRGRWSWRRRRCGRSFGSCVRLVYVPVGWKTRYRWCRTAQRVLFVIWTRGALSS